MTSDPPGWRTVDPHTGSLDSVLPTPPAAGETLVLSVDASEGDRDWAVQTATAAIREWSGSVDRLFVMDLDLQSDGIEGALDARRAEGVSDLLLFGASLARVVQTLDDGAFHFVSSGTPVASPRELLTHARWDDVVRSFREAGAVLVLYLPTDQPGAASLLSRADRIVRLARPSGRGEEVPAEVRERVIASLAPPDVDWGPVEVGDGTEGDESEPVWSAEDVTEEIGEVVDIADLAPDEPPVEVGAGVAAGAAGAAGEAGLEESTSESTEARWPGPVVDIRDLAPDEERVEIEGHASDGVGEFAPSAEASGLREPVVDIADLAPDEPVVDIADLAPDEPVDVPSPLDQGPEVPVERTRSPGGEDFEEESFAAGLDAIDAASEAGKQQGLSDFDLGELDALSESAEEARDEDREVWEEPTDEEPEDEERKDEEPGDEGWAPGDARFDQQMGDEHLVADEPAGEAAPSDAPAEEPPLEDTSPHETPLEEAPFEEAPFEEAITGDEPSEGTDTEEEVFEPSQEPVAGPGDLSEDEWSPEAPEHEVEEERAGAGADDDSGAADAGEFEGFSGELDLVEDAPAGRDEADEESVAETGPGPEAGVEGVDEDVFEPGDGDDFGDDLVTGPDFGRTSPEEEEIWGDDPDQEERAGKEVAGTGATPATEAREESGGREAGVREGGGERDRDVGDETSGGEAPVVGVDSGRRRDRKRGRPLRLLVLLVLLAVGAVTAHWYDVIDVPGLDQALAAVLGPAGTGAPPSVETAGPQPTSPIQVRSLLIDTYRDAQSAADVALALRGRLPDRIFAVAPVQADGDVTFQLLAGPANTAEQAVALRQTLAGVLTREDPSGWTPRQTSLAFLVDETEGLEAARARADAVTSDGVYAYVLRVSYPDGATAHRVYAGGYADPEEARALQGILSQTGIDATFTERRGEIPE